MAEITIILSSLLERTNQDKLLWQPTSNDRAFTLIIGDKSVIIQVNRNDRVDLIVLDEEGREIERMYSGGDDTSVQEDSDMQELYEAARSTALQIDSQLDELLEALENE